jgi:transposase
MPRLNERQRGEAIGFLLRGEDQIAVAGRFNVSQSTISRLRRRLLTTGSVKDRPRSGRPRVTTPRQDREIRLLHLRNRFRTAVETAVHVRGRHNARISEKTVRNRLKAAGLKARRPYKGLPLTRNRRDVRMDWLHRHRPNRFPLQRWRNVLFSDESRFTLFRADGRRRVYRRKGERFSDACVIERDRFGGGSIMVWGGIAHGRKTPLVVIDGTLTAVRYRDVILQPHAVPFVRRHNLVLQQDNARPHVARVCRDFLTTNNIVPLEWPPYSPDLSPIEHLWDEVDRRVRRRQNLPSNAEELAQAVTEEWDNIPMITINRLINSMHRRIHAAIAARGGHSRY